MKILNSAQMQEVDRLSTEKFGIPSLVLMENAGTQVVSVLKEKFQDLPSKRIAVFCGKGNNGGDGYVVARHLIRDGILPDVYLLADRREVKGDAKVNLDTLIDMNVPVIEISDPKQWDEVAKGVYRYEIIIDALLGTGINKPVSGLYETTIKAINRIQDVKVVSVDVPSGCSADSGDLIGETIQADITVALSAPKISHIFGAASQSSGELMVVPIGSPKELLESKEFFLNLIAPIDLAEVFPKRSYDSHKGTYGHILVVAGSRGKSGAAAMTGIAALRAGAGLVTVATAKSAQEVIASQAMELMTEGLEQTEVGTISEKGVEKINDLMKEKDVLAIGPGLSTHPSTVKFIQELVTSAPAPVVIDADAINSYANDLGSLRNKNNLPMIVTPHPGEMARLVNATTKQVQADRIKIARDVATKYGLYMVLKGYRTLVADPTGQVYVNLTGNAGMATAGSGDVLTGVIASLLVNRSKGASVVMKNYSLAVAAAVYVHGLAGDLAAQHLGEESLMASDILKFLPAAICQVQRAGSDR